MNMYYVIKAGSLVYYRGGDVSEGFYKVTGTGPQTPYGAGHDMYMINTMDSTMANGLTVRREFLLPLDDCAMIAIATRNLLAK